MGFAIIVTILIVLYFFNNHLDRIHNSQSDNGELLEKLVDAVDNFTDKLEDTNNVLNDIEFNTNEKYKGDVLEEDSGFPI